MIIQVILIAATVLVAWYVLRDDGQRGLALRRLLGCAVAAGGVVAILWPDALTHVANLVGVRRGTDLLLYGLVVVFAFVSASLYARVRALDEHLTVLVRADAVRRGAEDAPATGGPGA